MIDFIDIHTHRIEKIENTFSVFNVLLPGKYISEKNYFSAGWHPWHIEAYDLPQIENTLEEVASKKNVLAIGECGLDRSIKIKLEKQAEVFRLHFNKAKKNEKPLIIHCVRAYSDLLGMIKKEQFNGKFILHNFNGNRNQMDSFLKYEAFFSLGKQQLNRSTKFNESVAYIPPERIFLETDNSDFSIKETYFFVSDLIHVPIEVLKSQIKQNFETVFGTGLIE